jgi:hypothetical protein
MVDDYFVIYIILIITTNGAESYIQTQTEL